MNGKKEDLMIEIGRELLSRLGIPGFTCVYRDKFGIAWTGFHHVYTPRGKPSSNRSGLHFLSQLCADGALVAIPKGNYQRTGPQVQSKELLRDKFRDVIEVREPSTHPERLNFGLTGKLHVLADDGSGELVQTKVWRTFLLIADGKLHLKQFLVRVPYNTFKSMQFAGILTSDEEWSENLWFPIDVERLDLLSTNWARPNALYLVRVLCEREYREMQLGALRLRRDALGFEEEDEEDIFKPGSSVKKHTGQYEAPIVSYTLSLVPESITFDFSDLSEADTRLALKWVRRRIRVLKLIARQITISSEVARKKKAERPHQVLDPCPPYWWEKVDSKGDDTIMHGELKEGFVVRRAGTRWFDK